MAGRTPKPVAGIEISGPDADRLALAQANQKLATAALADAQAHATKLSHGPDPEVLALATARLAAAALSGPPADQRNRL